MDSDEGLDVAGALGAESETSAQVLSLYIPNRDRSGKEFNPDPWVKEASEILFQIGGGATVTPAHEGITAGEDGAPMRESTKIIYTYVGSRFRELLPMLREFLHRFGRETNQREVGVELAGGGEAWFFRIKSFDARKKS